MNENENIEVESRDNSAANIWIAIVLGTIALIVGLMPFYYLKDTVIPG